MGGGRYASYGLLSVLLGITSCSGNGVGLDQNGQPITAGSTSSSEPITPDLASIEAHVFTPICSKCHIGASAPEGLQLDAAHAYDFLVGVSSNEDPSLKRVNPGNPDASYMVLKIEGAPGIEGGQMPLGETPLPQATIDAIRQWITNGAPNVPGASTSEELELRSTAPSDQSTVVGSPKQVVLAFTSEIDFSVVNDTTIRLERISPTGLDSPDEPDAATPVEATRQILAANPSVLVLKPRLALSPGTYRVDLRGTGGGALADVRAKTLRADTSFTFTVEADR